MEQIVAPRTKITEPEEDTENTPTRKNLWQKLVDINKELRSVGIPKNGRAPDKVGGYPYAESDDVVDAVGKLFERYNVLFWPSSTIIQQTTDGKKTHTTTQVHGEIINADNPEEREEFSWPGEADSYGDDKSTQKANTSAVKFFLVKKFLIATGEKDDTESFVAEVEEKIADATPTYEKPTDNDRLTLFNMLESKLGTDETKRRLLEVARRAEVKSTKYINLDIYKKLVEQLHT